MNLRTYRTAAVAASIASLVLLASCQQFFTTSLAAPLARDSYSIPSDISVADANALLDQYGADIAAELVAPLFAAATAAGSDPASAAYEEAVAALVSAVVLSSGLGPAITTMATGYLAGDTSTDPLSAFDSVSINEDERQALLMIAGNPPDDLSPDDAYTAAIALADDAFTTLGIDIATIATLTALQEDALAADPSMVAALALFDNAQASLDESIFDTILTSFDFDFEAFRP